MTETGQVVDMHATIGPAHVSQTKDDHGR